MKQEEIREFAVTTARGFGGALFFMLPLLMTMEMWWLGFMIDRLKLVLFMFTHLVFLTVLAHFAGVRTTYHLIDHVIDALIAYAIGFITGGLILLLFGLIDTGMSSDEIVGKISLQAVPGSMGAVLSRSQFQEGKPKVREHKKEARYLGEMFLMSAGALFFAFNLAPTQEMLVINFRMTSVKMIILVLLSLVLMHALVYFVNFKGQKHPGNNAGFWSLFFRYTVVGYVIALGISFYVLWIFGRFAGVGSISILMSVVVLGFPASLGSAGARLIL